MNMDAMLKYIFSRAWNTKNWRNSDFKALPHYSNVVDLSFATFGRGLILGVVVVSGSVVKSGPIALLSLWVAVTVSTLTGLHFAELRSRFARVQGTLYDYVLFSSGEVLAFTVGWMELIQETLCAASVAKSISAYLDIQTDMRIRNFTATKLGIEHLSNDSYLDFAGFAVMLICIVYTFSVWNNQVEKKESMNKIIAGVMIGTVLIIALLCLSHAKFHLWKESHFSFSQFTKGAALFLLALDNNHRLFTYSDFRWLGIKRVVLQSYVISGSVLLVTFAFVCASLISVSAYSEWTTDATLVEAVSNGGMRWARFVIGPIVMVCLSVIGIEHLFRSLDILTNMARDKLIPELFKVSEISKLPSFLGISLVGVAACFATLSANLTTLIAMASLCSIVQNVVILSTSLALRYKPSLHMFSVRTTNNEDSTLIAQTSNTEHPTMEGSDQISDYLYGAFSNENDTSMSNSLQEGAYHVSDDEDDIDEAVEEFRLQKAIQRYQNMLKTKDIKGKIPDYTTYKLVKGAISMFIVTAFVSACMIAYMLNDINTRHVLILFILILLAVIMTACILLIGYQPKDKVLPKTLLIQAPPSPILPLLTIQCLFILGCSVGASVSITLYGLLALGLQGYISTIFVAKKDASALYHTLPAQAHQHEMRGPEPSSNLNLNIEDSYTFALTNDDSCLLNTSTGSESASSGNGPTNDNVSLLDLEDDDVERLDIMEHRV